LITVLTFIFAVGSAAMAEAPPASSTKHGSAANDKKNPCHDDIQKFCKDVKPGGGRVHACLSQHANELTSACGDARQQAKERVAKFHQACDADVQKLCPGVKSGHGRIAKCIKEKEAELSPACKAEHRSSRAAAAQQDQ
jgi:hypothetical protein